MRELLLSIMACAPLSFAGPAAAETLHDAMALAYQTNPTIRAERARLKATREVKAH